MRKLVEHPAANARVASIYGYPSDLDWTDGKPDVEYRPLVESAGRFYLLSADTLPATLKSPRRSQMTILAGLLSADDLVLEWPLGQGWRFCDPKGIVRDDQLYCWFVENIAPSTLKMPGIKTVPRDEYQLSYKTNPDQVTVSFVPDIGITHYEYHHHGAIADTTLIALRIPSRRSKEVEASPNLLRASL